MHRIVGLGITLTLAAQISLGQPALQQDRGASATTQPAGEARFAPGTALRVELVKTIDAKKAKAGDPVMVKTVDELMAGTQAAAPRGTKIFGHVVAATPHHGDSPSTLEIAFDKITLGAGRDVPMKAVIQALSKPVESPAVGDYGSTGGTAGGPPMGPAPGGRIGGSPTMGSPPGSAPNPGSMGNPGGMPGAGSATPNTTLPLNAQGVIGMSGVSLASGDESNSTITSQKHNVKLEGGTQMILRVTQ